MPDRRRKARTRKTVARRRPPTVKASASVSAVTRRRWMRAVREALLLPPHTRADLGGGIIPCGVELHASSGAEPGYLDIATYSGTTYVGLSTHVFGFGLGVPVTMTSKPAGYSFSGAIPVCTKDAVCANGQPKKHLVSVSGEVKTSSEPDELSYTYTVDLICGGVLACTEEGIFKGQRKDYSATKPGGTPGSATGIFYGKQSWTAKCCPERHVP
jgi:hypothetical protein